MIKWKVEKTEIAAIHPKFVVFRYELYLNDPLSLKPGAVFCLNTRLSIVLDEGLALLLKPEKGLLDKGVLIMDPLIYSSGPWNLPLYSTAFQTVHIDSSTKIASAILVKLINPAHYCPSLIHIDLT